MEFKSFPDVKQLGKAAITITQKLHGTNAQILVYEVYEKPEIGDDPNAPAAYDVMAGSRNRWLTVDDDNFGFAKFVQENKAEIIEKLGPGTWYGEWAGPGINSGEGLKEKVFALFDVLRVDGRPLPVRVVTVPLLYEGSFTTEAIDAAFQDLKTNGSRLVPGYMSPEGVVVHLLGTSHRFKKVFKPEETAWTKPKGVRKPPGPKGPDVSHLLQPIRLEKLLSREEHFLVRYPESLPAICKAYAEDLVKEGQIKGTDDEIKALKKALGGQVFVFVKSLLEGKL
jgi:hypothetical protein